VVRVPDYPFLLGAQGKFSLPSSGEKKIDEALVSLAYRDSKVKLSRVFGCCVVAMCCRSSCAHCVSL
jgi:hypothetical protein